MQQRYQSVTPDPESPTRASTLTLCGHVAVYDDTTGSLTTGGGQELREVLQDSCPAPDTCEDFTRHLFRVYFAEQGTHTLEDLPEAAQITPARSVPSPDDYDF